MIIDHVKFNDPCDMSLFPVGSSAERSSGLKCQRGGRRMKSSVTQALVPLGPEPLTEKAVALSHHPFRAPISPSFLSLSRILSVPWWYFWSFMVINYAFLFSIESASFRILEEGVLQISIVVCRSTI